MGAVSNVPSPRADDETGLRVTDDRPLLVLPPGPNRIRRDAMDHERIAEVSKGVASALTEYPCDCETPEPQRGRCRECTERMIDAVLTVEIDKALDEAGLPDG